MRGINVAETSIKKLKEDLPDYFRMRQPILLTGPVGIGKSSVIKTFTQERDLGFSVVYLSQMTSADVRGIPVPEPGIRRMDWYPPACFPLVPTKALLHNLYQKGLMETIEKLDFNKSFLLNDNSSDIESNISLTQQFIYLKDVLRKGIRSCDINGPLEVIRKLLSERVGDNYQCQIEQLLGNATNEKDWLFNDLLMDIELYLHNCYLMGEGKTKELELKFGSHGGILLLDELLAVTDQSVQIAANQLLLEGLLGDFELMEGWVVWAAGNRGEHGMLSNSNAATLDRVTHINLTCNLDEWIEWAKQKNFSYLITRFLENNPSYFHTGRSRDEIGKQIVFASPRSWDVVNTFIKEMGSIDKARNAIEGRLGDKVSPAFLTFVSEAENVPSISELMQCEDDELIKDKLRQITKSPSVWGLVNAIESYIEVNKGRDTKGKDYKEQMFSMANKALHIMNMGSQLVNEDKSFRNIPWHEAGRAVVDYLTKWISSTFSSSYKTKGTRTNFIIVELFEQSAFKTWKNHKYYIEKNIASQLEKNI